MPEGDTVWLAAKRLDAALAHSPLVRSDFRVPRYATTNLAGRTVTQVASRGKHLLTRLDEDLTLHTHFRMNGSWHLYRPGRRWRGGPDWQVRLVLETPEWAAVGYRIPVIDLLARAAEGAVVGHLGPDLLGPDWDPAEAVRRLRSDGGRAIGLALLDQRNLAGLGNLYMTELCFLAGVTPWTPAADVDLPWIVDRGHTLLRLNRESAAQITTGDARRGRTAWVFQRSTCLRCGSRVATAALGAAPTTRIGYWCPRCQRGPTPAPVPVRAVFVAAPPGRPRYRP